MASASFDFVWTGAFGRLGVRKSERDEIARELLRICRPGGACLITGGNRRCPVDLSGAAPLLRGPRCTALLDYDEVLRTLADAGSSKVEPLNLAGIFGWRQIPAPLRGLASLAERYVQWASPPERVARYAGSLNPMIALWAER